MLKILNCDLGVKDAVEEIEMTDAASPSERIRLGDILMCFSVYTNTKVIFRTKLNAEALPVVHGLKFISMIWIITAHTVFYTGEYYGKHLET